MRILLIAVAIGWCIPHSVAAQEAAEKSDETAIRAAIKSYADAFNKGDATAVAAHWSEDGQFVTPRGDTFKGRATIQKEFAAYFAEVKGVRVEVAAPSIEFIAPSVAIERGTARIIRPNEEPRETDYEAVHVKQNGSWKMNSVREADKPALLSHYDQLKELEWMIGEWVDTDDAATIETKCEWTKNGNFILRSFRVAIKDRIELEGTQIIGWDPIRKTIRSWVFDSDGGFGVGIWSRKDSQWTVRALHVAKNGEQASAINLITFVDKNTFKLRSVGREVDGQLMPNIDEVTVIRK